MTENNQLKIENNGKWAFIEPIVHSLKRGQKTIYRASLKPSAYKNVKTQCNENIIEYFPKIKKYLLKRHYLNSGEFIDRFRNNRLPFGGSEPCDICYHSLNLGLSKQTKLGDYK